MKTYKLEPTCFPDHTMMNLFDREWTLTITDDLFIAIEQAKGLLEYNNFASISINANYPNQWGDQEDDIKCDQCRLNVTKYGIYLELQGKWDWQDQYEFSLQEEI
jgi:hypothetical protein